MNEISVINEETIKNKIYFIRGFQVMLDRDLAELYGVETKRLNEQLLSKRDSNVKAKIYTKNIIYNIRK